MRIVNKILIITIALSVIFFTACEKEPIDIVEPIEPIEVTVEKSTENPLIMTMGKTSNSGFSIDCITITYPFDFELESGEIITLSDSIKAVSALSNEEDYVVDFVYPVEVTKKNGEVVTINNIEEIAEIFIECIPEIGWDNYESRGFPAFEFEGMCVQLAYPVSLQANDNSTISVENERAFANALANGYLYFKFPVNIVNATGSIATAEDDEALMTVLFNCDDFSESVTYTPLFEDIFCFDFGYPITLINENENMRTVNNENELYSLLFEGTVFDFVYPVNFVYEDETIVVVNDESKASELVAACFLDNGYIQFLLVNLDCY